MKNLFLILYLCLLISCQIRDKQTLKIEGELQQWHKVTLVVNGPETAEWGKENPFLDYRLEATFTNAEKKLHCSRLLCRRRKCC